MKKICAHIMAMVLSIFLLPGLAVAENVAAAGSASDAFAGAIAAPTNNSSFNGGDSLSVSAPGLGASDCSQGVSVAVFATTGTTELCKLYMVNSVLAQSGFSVESRMPILSAMLYEVGMKFVDSTIKSPTMSTSDLKQQAIKTATASTKAISPKPVMRPANLADVKPVKFRLDGKRYTITDPAAIAGWNSCQPLTHPTAAGQTIVRPGCNG